MIVQRLKKDGTIIIEEIPFGNTSKICGNRFIEIHIRPEEILGDIILQTDPEYNVYDYLLTLASHKVKPQ